jgi:predicted nucleic acid-binding protein
MASGVLLDTSFFITLADSKRANHKTARKFWRFFLEEQIPVYLSTIVVSEFYLKQELSPEILRACIVLPFNWSDAVKAAGLDFTTFKGDRHSRDALKDDVKIIAQADEAGVEYIVTDDEDTLTRFAKECKNHGKTGCQCIALSGGFDRAYFARGQRDFTDQLDQPDDEI